MRVTGTSLAPIAAVTPQYVLALALERGVEADSGKQLQKKSHYIK
ncbi:hypothetical protein [Chryseobacterium sp. NFX27]